MCSEKQSWFIYNLIYADRENKVTKMYEPTKSQEIMREKLEKAYGWEEGENKFQLAPKIQEKYSDKQASYIIDLLLKNKWFKAEKVLIK